MSVFTLPTRQGGDDFDRFEFSALVAGLTPATYDPACWPDDDEVQYRTGKPRPARTNARRQAIQRSLHGEA